MTVSIADPLSKWGAIGVHRWRLQGSTVKVKAVVAALLAVVSTLPVAAADLPLPVMAPPPPAAAPPPSPWLWTFDTDFRYFSWRANIG